MSNSTTVILWALIILALVIIGPIAVIWSLNILFPALAIPLSFDTWCAVVILSGVFKTTVTRK